MADSAEEPSDIMKDVIEKLRRTSERPQEKFLKVLQEYKAEDSTEWATHFPAGYRERLAPSWLGEIYSSGLTAKAYGKEFIRSRQLGNNGEAREVIPILAAVDAMVLDDQTPNAINSIALERLCRRGYGIIAAHKSVEKLDDWKRPGNAPKTWKSKVNEEIWRRLDPSRGNADLPAAEELGFTNRRLEEEVRREVDRDASMIKAFSKLEERRAATHSS